MTAKQEKAIVTWLFVVGLMVFAMIVLGGVTRLTHSGLSMVDWRPVTGWLPPLDAAEWERAFDRYQEYPEYKKLNLGMTLGEFKAIFWFEYTHRLLGRIIGAAFFVPMAAFWLKGWFDKRLGLKLVGLFVLGGLQGVLGWYMVKSGLVSRPDVSQYRLAAHLSLALVILGAMVWV
ncbi:MAG: COX15/CtaA family protein, partial [Proteobacteria bacterium]|nr:COX15/CtaA family protein [Pseudomonadota bacterium]